jgi:hypothetical protein
MVRFMKSKKLERERERKLMHSELRNLVIRKVELWEVRRELDEFSNLEVLIIPTEEWTQWFHLLPFEWERKRKMEERPKTKLDLISYTSANDRESIEVGNIFDESSDSREDGPVQTRIFTWRRELIGTSVHPWGSLDSQLSEDMRECCQKLDKLLLEGYLL